MRVTPLLLFAFSSCKGFGPDLIVPRRKFIAGIGSAIGIATAGAVPPPARSDDDVSVIATELSIVRRVRNKVFLLGQLDVASCEGLRCAIDEAALTCSAMQTAYSLESGPVVELHIQSIGGQLMPTLGVVDAILACPVDTVSYIEGFAASSATLLSVVCTRRYAHAHSVALLHQLSGGVTGTAGMMNDQLQNVNLFMGIVKDIYTKHTKIDPAEMDELLKHDLWLNAEQCLRLGVIDAIV